VALAQTSEGHARAGEQSAAARNIRGLGRRCAGVDASDRELLLAFEAAAIPSAEWTHRAHVRVAFVYLGRHALDAALDAMRRGIRRLNAANDVLDTPSSGYHETVTVAWLTLVAAARRAHPDCATSDALLARCPALLDKTRLRAHYSRDHLRSADARARFVEPDLAPLP
jgi:hypothetical protein